MNGGLEAVPWDQALARVTEGLEAVKSRHGGDAVGFLASGRTTNEELLLIERIASDGFGAKAIRFDAWSHALDHVPAILVEGPRVGHLDEILSADLLLVFDPGLADHHPQAASRILRAMEQGGKSVVLSPRRDILAERATLRLEAWSPEAAAAALQGGGDRSNEPLARLWREAERPLLIYPLKSLPYLREANLLRTFEHLVEKSGARVLLLFPRANSRGAFHRRKGTGVSDIRGLKALMVLEENPAGWGDAFSAILPNLEFLVVQDLFLTETTELAHVVLPAASFAEKGGTLTNTEGRLQALRPAVLPPGQARPGWAILADLARRLGISDVGSTLDEIQGGMRMEQVGAAPVATSPESVSVAAADPPRLQHIPNRLGCLWLADTLLRHTDDWQRENQDRWIEIDPEDAKALTLRPGWTIRVSGEGGEFTGLVRISDRVGPGVLCSSLTLLEGPVTVARAA
jgi:predicted molibdopterin-dependent oxidoreductase YjgC